MLSNLNKALALALAVAVLGGCATSKESCSPRRQHDDGHLAAERR